MLASIKHEQDEREELSHEEEAPERNHVSGLDSPIKNVSNINHCSEEEEYDCDVCGALSHCFQNKAHLAIQVGDENSGEDHERHLDPHVDTQPPPEVGNDGVCLRSHVDGEEDEEDHHHERGCR